MATVLSNIRQAVRTRVHETLALTTPGSPLVAPQGTPGTTSITYAIVTTNSVGSSNASQSTTVATANTTLSGTNYNQLNWQAVPGAAGYDIYRTVTAGSSPTTTGKIGSTTSATTSNDTGLAGDSSTAPTINTSGITAPYWTEAELLDIIVKEIGRAHV